MEWFANLLRHYPELAIFLTLAFGFWIGKFKIKKFMLGTVTSVLLVGEMCIRDSHISARTPERFLRAGCKVIRQGHGYPSVFNPDVYIQELMRQGKSLQDAREGGCSGCIEVGAFGKEAYVLTG